MDFKKVLIAGVVIAGAWYLYNKSKKPTTSTDESASGINGAQYLAEHGAFQNATGGGGFTRIATATNAVKCDCVGGYAPSQAACDRACNIKKASRTR